MNNLRDILLPLTFSAAALVGGPVYGQDLAQTYQAALQNDPQLQSAQAGLEAAKSSRRQSRALYLPSLTLSGSSTRTDAETTDVNGVPVSPTDPYTTTSYSLTLSQPLYRRDYMSQFSQASANLRKVEAEYRAAEQELIIRLASRYFDVLAARDNLEFAKSEKNAIARQLEQTKQRFEVGLIAITDVHEAQAAHDLALASEITAENELSSARQALQEIIALPPEILAPLSEKVPLLNPEPNNIRQWEDNAHQNNYSLLAATASVEIARQQLQLQRAGRHPTLDLVATQGNSSISGGILDGQETDSSTISVQLSLPLFQGGAINASIQGARHQLTQARQAMEQTRRSVQRESSDAFLSVQAGVSRVKALKQAVISSQSALTATEAGFEVGTRTTVDVLNVRRELFRAQRDYARARYDYILATLRLKQAAGLLEGNDVERINAWLSR